jgi:hypothetical protein
MKKTDEAMLFTVVLLLIGIVGSIVVWNTNRFDSPLIISLYILTLFLALEVHPWWTLIAYAGIWFGLVSGQYALVAGSSLVHWVTMLYVDHDFIPLILSITSVIIVISGFYRLWVPIYQRALEHRSPSAEQKAHYKGTTFTVPGADNHGKKKTVA